MKRSALLEQIICCTSCELHAQGGGPVPFRGQRSDVMILGEAPGKQEDRRGKPFVGPSGRMLFDTLAEFGLDEAECFVANTVCCWPARDRTPTTDQIYACRGHLFEQIKFCKPKYILALGRIANWTFGRIEKMDDLHGNWYPANLAHAAAGFEVMVMPTYHPAYIIYNQTRRRPFRDDLRAFVDEIWAKL
jgi:uracil-DNA glycosylase